MKRTPSTPAEWIAIILVPAISLLNIALRILGGWDPSFVVSLLGLLFALSFIMNWKAYTTLLMTWAVLQLVIVKFPLGEKVVDFSQVISLGAGMNFNGAGGFFYLGIGFLGLLYVPLAIKVRLDATIGKMIVLRSFKKDSFLADILPAEAKILKRITMGDEEIWFLVELVGKTPPVYALIQGKEHYFVRAGQKQIVHYLKVDDPATVLFAERVDKNLFKTGAWAVVD